MADLSGVPPLLADHPEIRRARSIPRRAAPGREEFAAAHIEGGGSPVLITDELDTWPAGRRWTFDFFRESYADDVVTANSPMFLEGDVGLTPVQVRLRLADYVDYILDPSQPPRGEYTRGSWEELQRNRVPLYDPAYRVLARHPELAADVVSSPSFVDDLFALLPAPVRGFLDANGSPVHYLFLAPAGSTSFLHADYWGTHAYLAQITGRKLCVLFSPADSENVYGGAVRNPLRVDPAVFPRYAAATPYAAILEPGEMIFIPSGWWHFVVGLTPSITYSYDFFTAHNLETYFLFLFQGLAQMVAAGGELPPHVRRAVGELEASCKAEIAARQAPAGVRRPGT